VPADLGRLEAEARHALYSGRALGPVRDRGVGGEPRSWHKVRDRAHSGRPLGAPVSTSRYLSIRLAKTDADLDLALRFRHDIFALETGTFEPRPDRRYYDRFDVYPGTTTVIARDHGRPERPCVASLRFAPHGPFGLPSDAYYDFGPLIRSREREGRFATMGMLAIDRPHRRTAGLLVTLVSVAWRELRRGGVRFIVAPCLPAMAQILTGMGGEKVDAPFLLGDPPTEITPMLLDMAHASPSTRAASHDPTDLLVEELEERRIYREGAEVITEGSWGDEAFIIMHGTARLVVGGQPTPYRLGPGEMFGELALLGDGTRTATIVAESKILDVGVVPAAELDRRLDGEAGFARRFVEFLVERLRARDPRPSSADALDAANLDLVTAQHILQGSGWGEHPVPVRWLKWSVGGLAQPLFDLLQSWAREGIIHVDDDGLVRVLDVDALADHTTATISGFHVPAPPTEKMEAIRGTDPSAED
jgi:CRP-like cAMP-binding protein